MENTSANNQEKKIIKPGSNCWTYETASHVAFLVDAAEYFSAVELALMKAQRSVYIAAWDIKTYTLFRDQTFPDRTIALIELLNMALDRNPDLNIHILCWKRSLIFSNDREFFARLRWKMQGHRRLRFRLDPTPPLGASHHQKIVVIDNCLAFCGGMDITDQRWDMPRHSNHVFRRDQKGRSYKPYHDVQMAVFGPPASSLGDLFRDRWFQATGERLERPPELSLSWPEFLISDMENVRVAIARTFPDSVHEVARLGADAILSAQNYIYIENQYLSSEFMVQVLERKIAEPRGPELMIILPRRYVGLMENAVIGAATSRAIARLRSKDRYGRLGIFYLETVNDPNHDYVKVHSKVLIIDNRFLKIGSANLSERSMGVDTECDLAIEAAGNPSARKAIEAFLFRLLAEHNDCSVEDVRFLVEQEKSLLGALAIMRQDPSCRLQELVPTEVPPEVSPFMKIIIEPSRPWRVSFQETVRNIVRVVLLKILSLGSLLILLYLLLRGVFAK